MTNVTWAVDADGDWSDGADWSTGMVPGRADNVTIDTADPHTITHSAGRDIVDSLTVGNDDFTLTGGVLTVRATASFANLLTVSGGRLVFPQAGQTETINTLAWSGGKLTLAGAANVTGAAVITSHVKLATLPTGGGFRGVLDLQGSATLSSGSEVTVGPRAYLILSGAQATLAGWVKGAGSLFLEGGTQTVGMGATITVANWGIDGPGTTILGRSLFYRGNFQIGNATLDLAGFTLTLNGPADFLDSTINSSGTLITRGATTLDGLSSSAGARLTWSNFGTVSGGGAGGATLTVVNSSTGVFDLTNNDAFGAASFVNDGLLKRTAGSGNVNFYSSVDNSGTILISSGGLKLYGPVSGSGGVTIQRGVLLFQSTFSQNVDFTGTAGRLQLAQSQAYGATITGFSTSGGTSLALKDINFVGPDQATYSGTTSGGVLTVTDGTHTAHINLVGDYLGATFTTSKGARNGTVVVDTTPAPAAAHRFIAAAAALGGRAGETIRIAVTDATHAPLLARPQAMTA